jgi:superfamily I DNA and RNA helicase
MVVSENATMDEIVQAHNFDNEDAEITFVCNSIVQDIQEGLKPEDIMVVSVDDRNARSYLRTIQARLIESSIQVNNVHEDTTSLKEFWLSGHVTLSTVHKAKGNEAYMVYVIGADAPMSRPNVRRRNILFTAMSRAKAWLRVTGQGDDAAMLCAEIVKAKENFPRLEFIHPGPDEIDIIKRDVAKSMDRKWRIQQVLSELVDLTEEDDQDSILEMIRQVDHRGPKKGKKKFGGSSRG